MSDCSLCKVPTLPILWSGHNFRIVLVTDQNIKGYLRLELLEHVSEIHQLSESIRQQMNLLLHIIEISLVNIFHPDKINIASLGNMTPHVHWHIVSRYKQDNFFPDSIWSNPARNNRFENTQEEISNLKHQLTSMIKQQDAEQAFDS